MTAVDPRYRFAGTAGVVWLGLPLLPVATIAVTVAATDGMQADRCLH